MTSARTVLSPAAVLGNDTLDFDYYNSVERYDQYVSRRPSCYIDRRNRGALIPSTCTRFCLSAYVDLGAESFVVTQ